jgi:Cys-tRNA(Pro)/Cys-tRNA(Cys) deacylase
VKKPDEPLYSAGTGARLRTPAQILQDAGVTFTLHEHSHDSGRFPPAAALVKTLAVTTGGELVLAALLASDTVHVGKLARALGVGRSVLDAVSTAALEQELGFEAGAVSLLTDFPAARLIDERVLAHERIFTGAGRVGSTIELAAADLVAVSDATVAALVAPGRIATT